MQLEIDWSMDSAERRVLIILRTHRGLAAAIPMPTLASLVGVETRQVQAIVHRLRVNHAQAIGSTARRGKNGYYMLATAEEMDGFRREQRRKALGTLLAVARACNATLPDLLGQLRMEWEEANGNGHAGQAAERRRELTSLPSGPGPPS